MADKDAEVREILEDPAVFKRQGCQELSYHVVHLIVLGDVPDTLVAADGRVDHEHRTQLLGSLVEGVPVLVIHPRGLGVRARVRVDNGA